MQLMTEAIECALKHLAELDIRLLESMLPELEAWWDSVDPKDESSFANHPVLRQRPMGDPLHLVRMHVLCALVRAEHAWHSATSLPRMLHQVDAVKAHVVAVDCVMLLLFLLLLHRPLPLTRCPCKVTDNSAVSSVHTHTNTRSR